jgi:hypothetical protein
MASGGILGGAKRDVDLCGKGHVSLIPICVTCTTDNTATVAAISNLQFPFRVIVRRVFVCAITAFGGGKELVVIVGDGTNIETITSAHDVKVASLTTGTAVMAANTDIYIEATLEGLGTASVTNIVVFFEPMDEFNDPG